MKFYARACASLFLSIAVFCPPVYADGFEITSVDFYPSGAKITLRVQSDGEFSFDLPGAYDSGRVRCMTMDHVTSVKVENVYVGNETPPELDSVQSRLDEATRAVSLLEGRKAALEQTRMIFEPQYSSGGGRWSVVMSADEVPGYVMRAQKMRIEAESALTDIAIELPRARKILDRILKEYQDLERSLTERRGVGSENAVRVRGTTDGSSLLIFEAFTPHAGWNVAYEMRLDSVSGAISAVMNAIAWQRTGMGFDGVFSFHTRAPLQSVTDPQVMPYTVGLRRSPSARQRSYQEGVMADSAEGWRMAGAFESAPKAVPAPQAISTLTDVSVIGSGRIDGDSAPVRIKLGEFSLESTPELIAIPDLSNEAWVVAGIDVIPESFLPGEAELSVDGAASGKAYIQQTAAKARVTFGMSPRILSKKTPFIPESGSSWTGSGSFRDGYTLEVTNGMDIEREVTVLDRAPVSIVDSVSVSVEVMDPRAERDDMGRLTWKIKLAPGETKKIAVRYTIKYPGGETLEYGSGY